MDDSESMIIGMIAFLPILVAIITFVVWLTTGVNPLDGIFNIPSGEIGISDNRFRD